MRSEAAFGLQVNEISPGIHEGNTYHIIKLERRFPASNVGFENVDKDTLRHRLTSRLIEQQQQSLEVELFKSAKVTIFDEVLRRQYRAKYPPANR